MKQKLETIQEYKNLPISVEEEYQFNNQMFQISDVKDNYYNTGSIIQEEIGTEQENPEKKQIFLFSSENAMLSKNSFVEGDQIRVKFSETNTENNLKIELNDNVFDLRTMQNEQNFFSSSIEKDKFMILEYRSETVQERTQKIVEIENEEGIKIPTTEEEIEEKVYYFFKIRYIEDLNCPLVENNYNMYYKTIIASIRDFEKKYTRSVFDTSYKFFIDSISDGNIILPVIDAREITKVSYLSEVVNEETGMKEVLEKDLSPDLFTVLRVGDYQEQLMLQTSSDFKIPEDILNDGSSESEMPYIIYFSAGFENNILPSDLKLAFMNDVQFKLFNRGSDILAISDKTANTTDFVKNVFKNYKHMNI